MVDGRRIPRLCVSCVYFNIITWVNTCAQLIFFSQHNICIIFFFFFPCQNLRTNRELLILAIGHGDGHTLSHHLHHTNFDQLDQTPSSDLRPNKTHNTPSAHTRTHNLIEFNSNVPVIVVLILNPGLQIIKTKQNDDDIVFTVLL